MNRIAELTPQLVTFNGSGFDLPVLRYRAMIHVIPAVGLCPSLLSPLQSGGHWPLRCALILQFPGQVSLHELCRVMGLPGKPNGISGADVDQYHREGRIREIAEYCESDVLNTYRFALVVVCTLSYASYLAQRYLVPTTGGLWTAALGGLYSSTATTVVLARRAKTDESMRPQAQVGITLATGIMYLCILTIVTIFNLALAYRLAIPLLVLSLAALLICALQYWLSRPLFKSERISLGQNPLELGAAAIFAILFIFIWLLSTWVTTQFGVTGVYWLASIIGFTDIDPFVINLAQGGTSAAPTEAIASAILIAASSNNLLKAGYAALFAGGWTTAQSAAALGALAAAGIAIAFSMAA